MAVRVANPNDPIHKPTVGCWKKGEHASPSTEWKPGHLPWNKGLDKSDPRVAAYGKKGKITRIGRKLSAEHKKRISIAESIPVICIETGVVYNSMKEASLQTGICKNNISLCCCGKRKTAGKYHWKKVEKEN